MKWLDRMEEVFCGTALLMTAIILFVNVMLRYFFKASTSWAEELIKYMMVWIAFIGASICVRREAHVRIDILFSYLPPKVGKVLNMGVYLISLCFCMAMVWYGYKMTVFSMEFQQLSPALQIPMWIPYLSIPIGFALMTLRFSQQVFRLMVTPTETKETNDLLT